MSGSGSVGAATADGIAPQPFIAAATGQDVAEELAAEPDDDSEDEAGVDNLGSTMTPTTTPSAT